MAGFGDGDEFNFASSVHGDVNVSLTINVYGGNGPVAPDAAFQAAVEAGVQQAMRNLHSQARAGVLTAGEPQDRVSQRASRDARRGYFR